MRTRRQTRLQDQNTEASGSKDVVMKASSDTSSDEEPPLKSKPSSLPPRRKKRALNKSRSARKGNKANIGRNEKLARIFLLPIEVFTEVASYLLPLDIIHLARSCKYLRGLLMGRSAQHIWELALHNVPGLPPCPKDLCEPQYAALVFSKFCSMCGVPVVKPMDPYLNVRLCNACREENIISIDEVEPEHLRVYIPQSLRAHDVPNPCLRAEVDAIAKAYARAVNLVLEGNRSEPHPEARAWAEERAEINFARMEFGLEVAAFLDDMAEARTRELEEAKGQRRQELKRRLEKSGWEESDWTFPQQVARKWATLVESPKPLTNRGWQTLYPKLIPYLEKNQGFQTERFKTDRRRRRERRMRALLIGIKKQQVLLRVNRRTVQGEPGDDPIYNILEPYLDSDGDLPKVIESQIGNTFLSEKVREPMKVTISRPFPPLVDALALPVVAELLEDDTDADTLEDKFEDAREEVEEAIRSWGRTVEQELLSLLQDNESDDTPLLLKPSTPDEIEADTNSDTPDLELQFDIPPEYASFLENLSPETCQLLRADSVFRVVDDKSSPLPLFYPEMFSIFQDRTNYYFWEGLEYYGQRRPKLGYSWNTNDVACYPEGMRAAKAILRELERPNATQFELQALGPRFVCGRCGDKWIRNWNEIVQHYAEALVHARIVQESTSPAKDSVVYNQVHSLGWNTTSKGKTKPLVEFLTPQEVRERTSDEPSMMKYWMLFKCNLCTELGVSFLSSKETVVKHIRAAHAIKQPKAEHRMKANEIIKHARINTRAIKPHVSGTSTEPQSADEGTWTERARAHGPAVYWSEWGSKAPETWDDE